MTVKWLLQKKILILSFKTVLENFLGKMRFSQSRVITFILVLNCRWKSCSLDSILEFCPTHLIK